MKKTNSISIQEFKKENKIEMLRNKDIQKIINRCKYDGFGIRKTKNEILKEELKLLNIKLQKEIKYIYINIEWKKNYMWGMNPHATIKVIYKDGSTKQDSGFTCSGCGYDKESTVLAEIFNKYLKGKLLNKKRTAKTPYGVYLRNDNYIKPFFDGGIGTSCFYNITKYLGGKFKQTGNTKTTSNFIVEF